ncbi:hypothetical protein GGG16DRAFT_47459 [Schizophyllum commune]
MSILDGSVPPVHRLSTELVEAIILCISQPITNMITAQVCRYWREVTLNSPRLWTCIYVDGPLTDGSTHLVRAALARSKPLPIHITLTSRRQARSTEEVRLWDDIVEQASRWENARLLLPFASAMKITAAHAPLLRTLNIGVLESMQPPCTDSEEADEAATDDEEEDIVGPEFCVNAPLLQDATITGTLRPVQIGLPYAQLIHLNLQLGAYDDSLRDLISVLQPCAALKHLTVSMITCSGTDTEPFTLPSLEVLDVDNQATELCRDLTAPSLHKVVFRMEHVDLQDYQRYLEKELLALLRLARRCGDQITSLTVRVESFQSASSSDILDRVLRALPGITDLETWEGLAQEGVYEHTLVIDGVLLRKYDPGDPFLPNLARLSMHTHLHQWFRDDMEEIKAMVDSRRQVGVLGRATLQRFELDQWGDLWPDDGWQCDFSSREECERTYVDEHSAAFEWMLEMRKSGLDVQCNWLDKYLAFKSSPWTVQYAGSDGSERAAV